MEEGPLQMLTGRSVRAYGRMGRGRVRLRLAATKGDINNVIFFLNRYWISNLTSTYFLYLITFKAIPVIRNNLLTIKKRIRIFSMGKNICMDVRVEGDVIVST
jgi:hypothetical protein